MMDSDALGRAAHEEEWAALIAFDPDVEREAPAVQDFEMKVFSAGFEAGARVERKRWQEAVKAILSAQYPPGILRALDALAALAETEVT